MKEQAPDKVPHLYKKAYNHADMICTYMPHLLDGMHIPKDEPSEYTRGFQDRVNEYEKELGLIKDIPKSPKKEELKDPNKRKDLYIDKE